MTTEAQAHLHLKEASERLMFWNSPAAIRFLAWKPPRRNLPRREDAVASPPIWMVQIEHGPVAGRNHDSCVTMRVRVRPRPKTHARCPEAPVTRCCHIVRNLFKKEIVPRLAGPRSKPWSRQGLRSTLSTCGMSPRNRLGICSIVGCHLL